MKIPSKLKIGGFNWEVIESQDVANEGQVWGSTHARRQRIFIEPGETEQKKAQTFLHEILHAVFWQQGIAKIIDSDKKLTEEEIINSVAMGLFQVLRDNDIDFRNTK